jgi:DNA-binding response OmpR family regulator/HPt (histidine-containing phosphotransfer) domain-containing protein
MKILFVEDDVHICEAISKFLSAHHYAVDVVTDGEAGLEMAMQWPYDLILLDVMMPKLNGIEVCRRLRLRECQAPIMFLTGKGADEDVIAGLDAGADDYVAKSCEPAQMIARIRALLRRSGAVVSSPLLTWGGLCLDPSAAQVTFNQNAVTCRPKEYALLELFLRNPKRLLNRSNIIDHLWSYDDVPVEGSVTTLIKDLRRRLKTAGMTQDPIETVYGLGYRLKPEPETEAPNPSVKQAGGKDAAIAFPSSTAKAAAKQRVKAVLQQMDAKFRDSWSERLTVLDAAVTSFQAGDCTRQQQEAALVSVHKLVGGLGTFGYDNAAAVAETLEAALRQHLERESQWTNQCSDLLRKLKQELYQVVESPSRESVDTRIGQYE